MLRRIRIANPVVVTLLSRTATPEEIGDEWLAVHGLRMRKYPVVSDPDTRVYGRTSRTAEGEHSAVTCRHVGRRFREREREARPRVRRSTRRRRRSRRHR
jgi:hypothetical protein